MNLHYSLVIPLIKGRSPFPMSTKRYYSKAPKYKGYWQKKTEHGWEEVPVGEARKENKTHSISGPNRPKRKGRSKVYSAKELKLIHIIMRRHGKELSNFGIHTYKQLTNFLKTPKGKKFVTHATKK